MLVRTKQTARRRPAYVESPRLPSKRDSPSSNGAAAQRCLASSYGSPLAHVISYGGLNPDWKRAQTGVYKLDLARPGHREGFNLVLAMGLGIAPEVRRRGLKRGVIMSMSRECQINPWITISMSSLTAEVLLRKRRPEWADDLEAMMLLVSQDGKALQWASNRLQGHEGVVRRAIESDYQALQWVDFRTAEPPLKQGE